MKNGWKTKTYINPILRNYQKGDNFKTLYLGNHATHSIGLKQFDLIETDILKIM